MSRANDRPREGARMTRPLCLVMRPSSAPPDFAIQNIKGRFRHIEADVERIPTEFVSISFIYKSGVYGSRYEGSIANVMRAELISLRIGRYIFSALCFRL